jgi:hypothetical protein
MTVLHFLWPFEVASVFTALVFFFVMFVFPGWVPVLGFLASLVISYALISLRGHLEEVAS